MPLALRRWGHHVANLPALPGLIWKNVKHLCAPQRSAAAQARRSVPTAHFEAIYARNRDLWKYGTSAYEQEKYTAVLTRRLADRCDELLAIDVVERALAQARALCADTPQVSFARARIPEEWPEGRFDLIVISEVLYYLDPADIRRTATACLRSLEPGGTLVLVNFLPPNKRPCYADEAVTLLCAALRRRCEPAIGRRAETYRLDVLRAVR